ncbi:hypothetical protein [Bradyrhizobium sp. STM 3562]
MSITGGQVSESCLFAAGGDDMIDEHHRLLAVLQEHGAFQSAWSFSAIQT